MTAVEVTLAKHDQRLGVLEKFADGQEKRDETIGDLRVELGKLQTQIKVTWILMLLVISGLVGVAFSFWQGGGL